MKVHAGILALALLSASASGHAFKLINDEEAGLPAAAPIRTRGITRGPGIRIVSPDPAGGAVKTPFDFRVVFEPRGGAKIDTASVKVFYLKAMPVDLLERVKPGLSEAGIQLAGAEVPPGEHQIRVMLQDTEGRKGDAVINLTVAK